MSRCAVSITEHQSAYEVRCTCGYRIVTGSAYYARDTAREHAPALRMVWNLRGAA